MQAGKIVKEAIDADPDFAYMVNEKNPEISVEMVMAFDKIGRNELHPRLLLSDRPGPRKLRRLPYRLQCKFLESPIPVLIKNGKSWENLNIDLNNLTPFQASQVFSGTEVRNEAAQRAWLESKASESIEPAKSDSPYRMVKGDLVVMQPCTFTRKELARILADME